MEDAGGLEPVPSGERSPVADLCRSFTLVSETSLDCDTASSEWATLQSQAGRQDMRLTTMRLP